MKSLRSVIGNSRCLLMAAAMLSVSCSKPYLNRNGEYVISTPAQLVYFGGHYPDGTLPDNARYVLGDDIDMSGTENYIPPKSAFLGEFDGRGHVIRNLTIRLPEEANVGFFRSVGDAATQSEVRNLALVDIHVLGRNTVGAMAGLLCGTISNCYVSGEVHAMAHCAGGMAGRMPEMKNKRVLPQLNDCFSSAAVICDGEADSQGGLCGRTISGTGVIRNCICTGEVYGYGKTGGLIGQMGTGTKLLTSVALNKYISSNSNVLSPDCIVGMAEGMGVEIDGNIGWNDAYAKMDSYPKAVWDMSVWEWNGPEDDGYISLKSFSGLDFSHTERWTSLPSGLEMTTEAGCDRIVFNIVDSGTDCRYSIVHADRNIPSEMEFGCRTRYEFDGLEPGRAYHFACGYDDGNRKRIYRKTVNTRYVAVPDPEPIDIACSVTQDPMHSLNFSWTTRDTSQVMPTVWISTSSERTTILSCPVMGKSHVEPVRTTVDRKLFDSIYAFHQVTVSGLEPSTEYFYMVGDSGSGTTSDMKRVVTAPGRNEGFTFAYVTDLQIGSVKAEANALKTYESIEAKAGIPDFIFNAGDMTEDGCNYSQWHSFFRAGESLLSKTFIVPVQGNHDTDADFANHFPVESSLPGIPAVYSFDYGCAHFVALNTQYWQESDLKRQMEWMADDLKSSDARWKFILLHRAVYAATDHVDDADINMLRKILAPYAEASGVDAVLMGHDHSFSRGFVRNGYNAHEQYAMDGESFVYQGPRSPLYIVNGTGGTAKWYYKIEYDASGLDRVSPCYEFIDRTSADYDLSVREQSFSVVRVASERLALETWFFKWSPEKGYEPEPYLFDSLIIEK